MRPLNHRIGILHCGEMGTALGKLLLDQGCHVTTTTAGRSAKTVKRVRETGISIVQELGELVSQADLIIATVSPSAATQVAEEVGSCCECAPDNAIYLELNSIGSQSVSAISKSLAASNYSVVDGAVHGQAARLSDQGVIYLSGKRAGELEELFSPMMRVRVVGSETGQASELKQMMAGFSKSITALFLELGIMAESSSMLDVFRDEFGRFYSATSEAIERMLPTYPTHVGRRITELEEIVQSFQSHGIRPELIPAAKKLWESVSSAIGEGAVNHAGSGNELTVDQIIKQAAQADAKPQQD